MYTYPLKDHYQIAKWGGDEQKQAPLIVQFACVHGCMSCN